LNFDKNHSIQFINTSTCTSDIQIIYEDKPIPIAIGEKFIGLIINNILSWKTHSEYIKSKLSCTCYAMRSVSQTICITKHSANDLPFFPFFLPLCNEYWFIVLGGNPQTVERFSCCKKRLLE